MAAYAAAVWAGADTGAGASPDGGNVSGNGSSDSRERGQSRPDPGDVCGPAHEFEARAQRPPPTKAPPIGREKRKKAFRKLAISMRDDVVLCLDERRHALLGRRHAVEARRRASCFASLTSSVASTTSCGRGTTSCFASLTSCFASTSSGSRWTSGRRHTAVFFAALRAAVAHLLGCFPLIPLSCTNQPARTQGKRSDFKRRSSSSCVHLAFKWLLFTRNWCWQAQQFNFFRRFAPHFASRAINSTPK